jgi:hypothetical protein
MNVKYRQLANEFVISYAFQVAVDYILPMYILKAASDTDNLKDNVESIIEDTDRDVVVTYNRQTVYLRVVKNVSIHSAIVV